MLNELCIRNFAIIDHLSLQFGPGLNILTGETGAGKSIIIDAVGLLLGDRAAVEWVRTGAEMASIEATFSVRPDNAIGSELDTMLEEQALDDPDSRGWLVLTREVRRNGRNVCRVNGRTVNLQTLSDIANVLIDVHGQGEHLSLLRPKTHIHLLDHFAGLLPLRAQLAHHVGELRNVQRQLRHLRQDARMIAQRIDLLSFQAEEIRAANLRVGEDQELESERRRLGNAEALTTLAQTVHTILNQGDGEMPSAADLLGEAVGKLEKLARIDPDMTVTANEAQVLLEQLTDLARGLQDYTDTLEFNPERLQEVEERAELITGLRRKYGDTIEQICGFGEQAAAELAEIANWEVRTADLEVQEDKLLHTIGRLAAELTEKRRSAGEKLAAHVEMELSELNMNRARFGVSIEQVEQTEGAHLPDGRRVAFDGTGVDQVEFLDHRQSGRAAETDGARGVWRGNRPLDVGA